MSARIQDPSRTAVRYAQRLLRDVGWQSDAFDGDSPHPALDWARSGAMHLTGPGDGTPLLAAGPLASCMRGAAAALERVAGRALPDAAHAPELLGERAAHLGLTRRGPVSPGGSCRLLACADGWVALNLARPDDRALLPAWLEEDLDPRADAWRAAERGVRERGTAELVDRGRLLGLPVARAAAPAPPRPWFRVAARGPRARCVGERPRVVDLSSLWAGPLCTRWLADAGARVIKVESAERPDGARRGPAGFFDRLHAGKPSVVLPLGAEAGRDRLRRLLERADIVVESARPRALGQLGIDARALVRGRPGLSWLSITGYGREDARVAFGDDAGVAAGLAVGAPEAPLFCGDAIADPLTGLHAALAALAAQRLGGGLLLDVALCDVAAHALAFADARRGARVERTGAGHRVVTDGVRATVRPPRARPARGRARPLGADTQAVLRDLAC